MATDKILINVEALINAPVEKVWKAWTTPADIIKWNHASDDWHSPSATNELRAGGKFNYRMEAKDGSFGFDFEGTYEDVKTHQHIAYTIGDRKVNITFTSEGNATKVTEVFEAEIQNSIELQTNGWQAILDNFKKHVEAN